jgi:hypothetical protein
MSIHRCCRSLWFLSLTGVAHAHGPAPSVVFTDCTEFVGVAPIDATAARAAVPAAYTPVTDASGARLVIRVADCAAVKVGATPAHPGRVGQIGVMIVSPDGTGTDPATSINNYTVAYATNAWALAVALRRAGVPASHDPGLAFETQPAGGRAELFASVAGEAARWSLIGAVQTPTATQPFLANWWYSGHQGATKISTDIPVIAFDFNSNVRWVGSRAGAIGGLLPRHFLSGFPLSFHGAFASGTMTVTVKH